MISGGVCLSLCVSVVALVGLQTRINANTISTVIQYYFFILLSYRIGFGWNFVVTVALFLTFLSNILQMADKWHCLCTLLFCCPLSFSARSIARALRLFFVRFWLLDYFFFVQHKWFSLCLIIPYNCDIKNFIFTWWIVVVAVVVCMCVCPCFQSFFTNCCVSLGVINILGISFRIFLFSFSARYFLSPWEMTQIKWQMTKRDAKASKLSFCFPFIYYFVQFFSMCAHFHHLCHTRVHSYFLSIGLTFISLWLKVFCLFLFVIFLLFQCSTFFKCFFFFRWIFCAKILMNLTFFL